MPRPLVMCLIAVALTGCASDATYQGRTAARWNEVLLDRDEGYRVQALTALGEIGPEAEGASPNVRRVIADRQHNSWETRLKAVTVLWKISENPNATVMPRLVKWLRDPSDAEAQFGAEAAGRIGPDARQALPALRERYEVVDRKLAAMEESERASSDAAVLRKALVDAISSVSGGA